MPPTLQVPTRDGRSLDVWLAGPPHGTPLLFHYGTPSSGEPFAGHVDAAAARGLRLISFARPGYSGSTRRPGRRVVDVVDDTLTVLDELGIDRLYVTGWSGGGPHALACASLLADRVLGTAILAGVAPWQADGLDFLDGMGAENLVEFGAALEGPDALHAAMEPQFDGIRQLTAAQVAASLGDLIDEVDRGSLDDIDFAEWMATSFRDAIRESPWGWLDDDIAFTRPWGIDIASIPGRVHLWQGAHDRMVPYAHGQWLAAHCGGACVHLSGDQGHLSLVRDRFGDILDELVRPSA